MKRKVTLRDVAKYCGVSATTVSCVVRGVNCVKQDTVAKVQAAIKKLGYEADPAMRALAAYRTQLRGKSGNYKSSLAFFDSEPSDYSHAVYLKCREEAIELGYKLEYLHMPRLIEGQDKFSKRLWMQGIRGIILGPAQTEFDIRGFHFDRFAMVSIGAFNHFPPVDCVRSDYFHGIYMAAQKCAEKGHKRMALFLPSYLEARTGHRWLGGFHAYCHEYKHKPVIWLYESPGGRPGTAAFAEWIRRQKISLVFTLAHYVPELPVGMQLREVYLNDWHVEDDCWHISTPQRLIARECLRLLDHRLVRQEYGVPEWPRQISINGHWNAPE